MNNKVCIAAVLAVASLTTSASALEPPSDYCIDPDGTKAGVIVANSHEDVLPGITTFYFSVDQTRRDHDARVMVDCQTGDAVSFPVYYDAPHEDAFLARARERNRTLTLRQLARQMQNAGIDAQFGSLAAAQCACDPQTHQSSW